MTINHHLADDLIIGYAAGAQAEGWSLVVASHLALCPLCRDRYRAAEEIGGVLIEGLHSNVEIEQSWENVRARLGEPSRKTTEPPGRIPAVAPESLPQPVRTYVGGDVGSIKWRPLGRRISQLPIQTFDGETRARLLRIPGGRPVPEHGHRGRELTLIFSGSLRDGESVYGRGDVDDADEALAHRPVAEPGEDCICLMVTDSPLQFRSWLVRLVQPYFGI